MFTPDSSITGGAVSGWTSPVFATTADFVSGSNPAKRYVVTGISGTGPLSTDTHSVTRPFAVTGSWPAVPKAAPLVNPTTGIAAKSNGKNEYKVQTVKGVTSAPGLIELMIVETTYRIPAGADVNDPVGVKAGISFHHGILGEESADLVQLCIDGVLGQ